MTAITNVTPVGTVALPFTWTVGGLAYSLSSAQGNGCTDTVTPLTANAGGTYNVKGVPLYPAQAYQVISDANAHYGPVFVACQSLINQLPGTTAASTQSSYDYFPALGMGAMIDDLGLILVAVIFLGVIVWVARELKLIKK